MQLGMQAQDALPCMARARVQQLNLPRKSFQATKLAAYNGAWWWTWYGHISPRHSLVGRIHDRDTSHV